MTVKPLYLLIVLGYVLFPTIALAARTAVVISDRAIIWAEVEKRSPLGYIAHGKKIRVGEIKRNKGQMLPVVVSGRIGYVAVEDIRLNDADEETAFEATRFKEAAVKRYGENAMLSYVSFSGKESSNSAAGREGKTWNFQGVALKGEIRTGRDRVHASMNLEYLVAKNGSETFQMFSFGPGVNYALINSYRFKLQLEVQGHVVPWAHYKLSSLLDLNGFGVGGLGQATALFYVSDNWGVQVGAGLQVIRVYGIDRPSPMKDFDPQFVGPRVSASLVGRF